jgi:hypothetical protein
MGTKKITKTSKQVKEEKLNEDTVCPECKKSTGACVNTIVENKKVIKQYRCIFPDCGCEYEIEEDHDGVVHIETGEDMWKSGGMQQI